MYLNTTRLSEYSNLNSQKSSNIGKDRETIMTIIQGMTVIILHIICNLVLYEKLIIIKAELNKTK